MCNGSFGEAVVDRYTQDMDEDDSAMEDKIQYNLYGARRQANNLTMTGLCGPL